MKYIICLLCSLITFNSYAYRDENLNLCKREWWKTASVEDLEKELKNKPQWSINDSKCDVSDWEEELKGAKLIHFASSYSKDEKIIQFLIDQGADIHLRWKSLTPLMIASRGHNVDIVKCLLNNGAKVNLESEAGLTALQFAALFDNENTKEIFELLLEKGSDVNHINNRGESILISYIESILGHYLTPEQKIENIKFLMSKGADIHYINKQKQSSKYHTWVYNVTPLIAEIASGGLVKKDYSVIDFLLEQNVDVNAKDQNGRSALSLALMLGKEDIAQKLIDAGADVHQVDINGNSLIAQLVDNSLTSLHIDFLMQKGVDINMQNSNGETALIIACKTKSRGSLSSIEEQCNGDNPQTFIVDLLRAGSDVTIKDNQGKTALDYAEANPVVRCSDAYWMIKDSFPENQKSDQQDIQDNKIIEASPQKTHGNPIESHNFVSPLNFEDTPENREKVISFIKYCVKETYCEKKDDCNPIVLRMMEKTNLESFKNIANPSNVNLMQKTISTYCDYSSCCQYTTIEMMYNQMLQSENSELEW